MSEIDWTPPGEKIDAPVLCSCKMLPCTPHRELGFIIARVPRFDCRAHFPAPEGWATGDPMVDYIQAIADFKQHYLDHLNDPPPKQMITERQLENVKAGRPWWKNAD